MFYIYVEVLVKCVYNFIRILKFMKLEVSIFGEIYIYICYILIIYSFY